MQTEQILEKYDAQVRKFLNGIAKTIAYLGNLGIQVTPVERFMDEDAGWHFYITTSDGIEYGEVLFIIYDVGEGLATGVELLSKFEKGYEYVPYNYTDKLWIPYNDNNALDKRVAETLGMNTDALLTLAIGMSGYQPAPAVPERIKHF